MVDEKARENERIDDINSKLRGDTQIAVVPIDELNLFGEKCAVHAV